HHVQPAHEANGPPRRRHKARNRAHREILVSQHYQQRPAEEIEMELLPRIRCPFVRHPADETAAPAHWLVRATAESRQSEADLLQALEEPRMHFGEVPFGGLPIQPTAFTI